MKHSHQKIGEVFDHWASTDRAQKMADGHQFGAQYAFRLLDVGPQDRYLDIGCGLGYSVRWAAHVSSEVQALGVDISGTMVEEARRLSADLPNATFRQGYFPSVLAGETFHRIFSVEALYYLPDLTVALQQVFEHLRADGRFVTVIDYYRENEGCHDWVDRVGVPLVLWSIDEWTNGLSKAGFVNISAEQRRHPKTPETTAWQQMYGSLILCADRPS